MSFKLLAAGNRTLDLTPNMVGNDTVDNAEDKFNDAVISIINAIIGVLGVIAVLVIILGGVQYMTSSGDAGKVKKAKDTILYGIIGLVICIFAAAIVNFIIAKIA